MKFYSFLFFCVLILNTCKQTSYNNTHVNSKLVKITDSITANKAIEQYILPFKTHLNKTLDSTLAYAPETYSKKDGDLNTAIGNFMADVVYTQSNPVFNIRTSFNIDGVLLNYGGIRSVISKGPISARTAFEVMPFENSVVVAALNKKEMEQMLHFLATQQKAHPVANMNIILNASAKKVNSFTINKKSLQDKTYYIATSDYLASGGDHMDFFVTADTIYNTDYKIRNTLIDYFKKVDTITPKIDNRFIKIN